MNFSTKIIRRLSHTHSSSGKNILYSCQLSGEIIQPLYIDKICVKYIPIADNNKDMNTFYKPSTEVLDSPYFKYIYNKKNHVYAVMELYVKQKNVLDKNNNQDYTFWGP